MKRLGTAAVLASALFVLGACDDPQESAYRFNRYLGFWSLCAALAVVGGLVGLAVGYYGSRVLRARRSA